MGFGEGFNETMGLEDGEVDHQVWLGGDAAT